MEKTNQITNVETVERDWKILYNVGGIAALLIVLTALSEIIITFLPGGYASSETVSDWFILLHNDSFLGLRNLGLLNIIMTALGIPMYFALFAAHRNISMPFAGFAMILFIIGTSVFYATNRAFPMLELSSQYASATTDAQKNLLLAAGQAMLSVGQSHTPGTFLGFFFSAAAGIVISIVMLRGKVFNSLNAYFGIVGFSLLMIFDICSSFVPSLSNVVLIFAMCGGPLSILWYILIAQKLFQLGKMSSD